MPPPAVVTTLPSGSPISASCARMPRWVWNSLPGSSVDGVHPPLGVGQLDPVAGPERPAVHGCQRRVGGVGGDGGGSCGHGVIFRLGSRSCARSAMCRMPTTSSPDVTTYCAPGWVCTASITRSPSQPDRQRGQGAQRPGDGVHRQPRSALDRHRVGGGRVDQRHRPTGGVGDQQRGAGLPALGASALGLGQRRAGGHRPDRTGQPGEVDQREPAADPGGPDRLAGAPPEGDGDQQHQRQRQRRQHAARR